MYFKNKILNPNQTLQLETKMKKELITILFIFTVINMFGQVPASTTNYSNKTLTTADMVTNKALKPLKISYLINLCRKTGHFAEKKWQFLRYASLNFVIFPYSGNGKQS